MSEMAEIVNLRRARKDRAREAAQAQAAANRAASGRTAAERRAAAAERARIGWVVDGARLDEDGPEQD